ncbi:MAG: DUF4268 domain-containing protein [Betaproteobacteria bacterium]|nr:DUF4268 domain-containing protein [Betaproteobacteria bacterium]
MVQKIVRIPLREAFKHEAYDFTKWLEENIDLLNDSVGITLTDAESEQAAGSFSVDLVAEDEDGNKVIIENQLEKSDHDHLGKVITYLVAMEAKTAIWIVSEPRPEHVSAITWLNETALADFYLLKVEAVRIGDSEPAPLLTLIVGPTETTKAVGKAKQDFIERYENRYQFWKQFLDYAKTKTKLHASIKPGKYTWQGTGAGKTGLSYNYVILEHESAVELYIDRGKDALEENKAIFDELHGHKNEIEKTFGDALEWQRLEGKRACRIKKTISAGGRKDEDRWNEVNEKTVDAMIRLEKALKPFIS